MDTNLQSHMYTHCCDTLSNFAWLSIQLQDSHSWSHRFSSWWIYFDMVDGSEINALHMFTIVGAIIGAPITSVVEPRLLYFFAAFLSTSFFGIRRHRRQQLSTGETVRPSVKQDRMAKWLELEGTYYDQSSNKQIEYKLTKPVIGGTGMLAACL